MTEKQHEFYLKDVMGAESPKLDKGSRILKEEIFKMRQEKRQLKICWLVKNNWCFKYQIKYQRIRSL